MASVTPNQKDHAMPETPTVVGSPGDCGDTLDLEEEISEDEEGDDGAAGDRRVASLQERCPSLQRVIAATRRSHVVEATVKNSFLCSEENCELVFNPGIWNPVHEKVVAAISACVATVEKDVKRMSAKFLKECIKIDEFAAGLHTHNVFSSLDTDNELIKTHLSLLLQVIAMEYVENFQQMIKFTLKNHQLR